MSVSIFLFILFLVSRSNNPCLLSVATCLLDWDPYYPESIVVFLFIFGYLFSKFQVFSCLLNLLFEAHTLPSIHMGHWESSQVLSELKLGSFWGIQSTQISQVFLPIILPILRLICFSVHLKLNLVFCNVWVVYVL